MSPIPTYPQTKGLQIDDHRLSTIYAVVERLDHHCGDDLGCYTVIWYAISDFVLIFSKIKTFDISLCNCGSYDEWWNVSDVQLMACHWGHHLLVCGSHLIHNHCYYWNGSTCPKSLLSRRFQCSRHGRRNSTRSSSTHDICCCRRKSESKSTNSTFGIVLTRNAARRVGNCARKRRTSDSFWWNHGFTIGHYPWLSLHVKHLHEQETVQRLETLISFAFE